MRFLLALFMFALAPVSSHAQSGIYVERFGEGGLAGRNGPDIIDPLEGLMGGEFLCKKADENELTYVNCHGGYSYPTTSGITDLDAALEELVFLEAARRAHEFTQCQQGLFDGYARDAQVRSTLFENGYLQFEQIHRRTQALLQAKDVQERRERNATDALYTAKAEPTRDFAVQQERMMAARKSLEDINAELEMLISRVPFGNRPEMKAALFRLAKQHGRLTKANFNGVYGETMERLRSQAQHSTNYFNSIYVQSGTNTLYHVNEDFKKTLVKTGQIENVLRMHGMDQELASSFMCRAHARYEAGPRNLAIAEIPLYFVGAYGLSRLALRAGVAVIRATTAGARMAAAGAQAMQWAARGAMIGMEAYQYARIGDDVRQSCWPDEYLAAIQNGSCSPESEMNGVYQEASIAQCITNAALSVAPVAFVGGIRVWGRVSRAAEAIPTQLDEVVVTAPRLRGQNAHYFTAVERENTWESLSWGFTRYNSGSRQLSSDLAAGLNARQRIAIIEEIAGVTLNKAQAKEILRAVQRNGSGLETAGMAAREDILRRTLSGVGKTDEELNDILPRLYRAGAVGRVPEELLRAPIVTTDKWPSTLDNGEPSIIIAANIRHRLYLREASAAEDMRPVTLQGSETAQQALERYTREGYQGLRIEDGVLKQNIMQDPERLVRSLHGSLNGSLARSNVRGLSQARSAGRAPTADDLVRIAENAIQENRLRINPATADFRTLTPEVQLTYIDDIEAAWRAKFQDERFPRQSFDDVRTRILAGEFQGPKPATTYFDSAAPLAANRMARLEEFPSIQQVLDRTETTLSQRIAQTRPFERRDFFLSTVPDRLRPGISAAIDAGSNLQFLTTYMRRLQSETFLRMLSSNDARLIRAAQRGELDRETMEALLIERARARGMDVVTIDKPLSRERFNEEIGRGAVIDRGFGAADDHGIFTHMVQQDMYYDIIASRSGVSYQDINAYMGTPQGNDTWAKMFDGESTNAFRPEWIKTDFMRDNIPLTYLKSPNQTSSV